MADNTSWESLRSQHTASSPNTPPKEAITILRAFKKQFLKQVVFNVSFHGFHQLLSPAAANALDLTTLETSLLEHARSDNELHLNNAISFASLLPVKLSNKTQDELWMIIKTRIKNPRLHKIVRETLEEMLED